MPTTNSRDIELEKVYENIDTLIENIKEEENLIVLGDQNAIVGEAKVNNITGEYGLGKRNDREHLLEFCAKYNLTVTNTCFNHHRRRKYKQKMPGDINRYQINYIMIKELDKDARYLQFYLTHIFKKQQIRLKKIPI